MKDNFILAISGNDIFSGGGLHADLATYTVNQLHGFVAVTCLTAMTEQGFEVIPVDTTVFAQQLNSLKDVPFSAIKLGLLPNVEVADLALDFVKAQIYPLISLFYRLQTAPPKQYPDNLPVLPPHCRYL